MAQWVQALVNSSMRAHASSASVQACSIFFRAPSNMRQADQRAFKPELVSVGPFHHNSRALQDMEVHKLRFLSHLLGNQSRGERELSLQSLAQAMQMMEQEIRACYAETFDLISSEDFVRMMVVDGCFVLQLLRFYQNGEKDDPIFRTQWMVPMLRMDLLRLENQLPIQVLKRLFSLIRPVGCDQDLFIPVALNFFAPIIPQVQKATITYQEHGGTTEPEHLLALIYSTLKPQCHSSLDIDDSLKLNHYSSEMEMYSLPCATKLWPFGITLRKREKNLLDIKLHSQDGLTLEIPCLCIDARTGTVFKNLVAYEQCNAGVQPYLTSYIAFFKGLVTSPEDVGKLRREGIIQSVLGSDEEINALINNLANDIVYERKKCYLLPLIQKVHHHVNRPLTRYMGQLKQTYFSSPWTMITVLQAVMVLQLTVIQTLYTILSYNRPNK